MRRLAISFIAVLALGGVSACSPDEGNFKESAEEFIEDDDGEISVQTGLTFTDASCEEPASTDVGATFVCTATGSDGQAYDFAGEITAEDEFTLVAGPAGSAGGTPTPGTATGATTATGDSTVVTTPTS